MMQALSERLCPSCHTWPRQPGALTCADCQPGDDYLPTTTHRPDRTVRDVSVFATYEQRRRAHLTVVQ